MVNPFSRNVPEVMCSTGLYKDVEERKPKVFIVLSVKILFTRGDLTFS
jgi:hypothetical protein